MAKKTAASKPRTGKPRSYWYHSIEKKIEASGRGGLTKSNVLGPKKQPSHALREEVAGELLDQRKIVYVGANDWKGRSQSIRFLHRSILLELLGDKPPVPAFDLAQLRKCYDQLVAESGFPDVRMIDLVRLGSFPASDLLKEISNLHLQGKAELSRGDWSLASPEEKDVSIEWLGQHYLRVQLK